MARSVVSFQTFCKTVVVPVVYGTHPVRHALWDSAEGAVLSARLAAV